MKLRQQRSKLIQHSLKLTLHSDRPSSVEILPGPALSTNWSAPSNSIQTIRPPASGMRFNWRWKADSASRCAKHKPRETWIQWQLFPGSALFGVPITRVATTRHIDWQGYHGQRA